MLAHVLASHSADRALPLWRAIGFGATAAPLLLGLHASAALVALTTSVLALPVLWSALGSRRKPGRPLNFCGKHEIEFNFGAEAGAATGAAGAPSFR